MQDFEGVAAEDTLNPDLLAGDSRLAERRRRCAPMQEMILLTQDFFANPPTVASGVD